MKSKSLLLWMGMVLSVIFLTSAQSYAFDRDGEKGGKDKDRWEKKIAEIHQKLGLTPEQETQLKAQREQHRASFQALREQIKSKKDELSNELQKPDFDVAKVRQIHGDLKVLKAQKEDAHLEGILAIRQVLTPDQYKKFMEMKESFKDSHKGWKDGKKHKRDKNKKEDESQE